MAYCHATDQRMLLESPTAPAQIELGDWRGGAIATALAQGKTAQALLDQIPGLTPETVQGFLSLLLSIGLISPLTASLTAPESGAAESEALRQWEFHDLLFHTRSRQGRTSQTVGSTYRFRGEIEPLPVIKPQPDDWEKIALPLPDGAAIAAQASGEIAQHDLGFWDVLESRRSIRTYNAAVPLTLAQLGEFLYRSARLRQVFQMEKMDCSDRPSPGGGACYELELYIAVYQCEGLAQGSTTIVRNTIALGGCATGIRIWLS
ncbi:MAG: hypothetical protein HC857_07925 [Synechococcales cyanobacterium RU_4_20]|nr:hypothetical protein [Synechococcales cyanobacterium RU_4_20]